MKDFKNLILAACISFTCESLFAYSLKEGNVTALVGPYVYKSNFATTPTAAKSPVQTDVALVIQGDVSDHSALEIGLFHLDKIYLREAGQQSITEQTQLFHITMGYRYFFNPYLSLAAAFYSDYSMADPHIIHNDFAPGTELDTSARDTTEYGFDFSLQTELWSQQNIAVIADTRYALSVTNKANEKGDQYGLFLALKFLVQEKPVIKKDPEQPKESL